MADEYFSFEGEQSEFNAAIASLMRLDKIKQALAQVAVQNDYTQLFMMLKRYYMELIGILKEEDETIFNKKLVTMTNNYFEYLDLAKKGKRFMPRKLIETFDQWEMDLRNLEQKYGMNLPKKEDARFALMSTK